MTEYTLGRIVRVGSEPTSIVSLGQNLPLVFIGGPCAIESRDHALKIAHLIAGICDRLDMPWIYKSCYDKACRSSASSFHGVGIEEGLEN